MTRIAFIGKQRIFRVFTYFGTSVFLVSTPQEAEEKLQELVADTTESWGVIYIEEQLAAPLRDLIMELNKRTLPVISIVSSSGEPQGLGGKMLNNLVRKATGVDMRIE